MMAVIFPLCYLDRMQRALLLILCLGVGGDMCADFCLSRLGTVCSTKGSWCKSGDVCQSLFWTDSSKSNICYYLGDKAACPTSLPVSCTEAAGGSTVAPSPPSQSSTTMAPSTASTAPAGASLNNCIIELQTQLGSSKVVTDRGSFMKPYNRLFSSLVPGAMVLPSSGSDVASILNTAVKYGIKVAVRSYAGHSYVGQSSIGSTGILMVLSNMNAFSVVPGDGIGKFTAIVGPGLSQLEIYSRLAMNSPPLGLNGGTCPSVALSGLVSGGGEGMTSAFAGITSDRLLSAKAVVWDSSANAYIEREAPDDLMFALRGGMGGNFGVVTEWRMDAFTTGKVVVFSSKTTAMVSGKDDQKVSGLSRAFQAWMRAQPDNSAWGMVKFMSGGIVQFVGQCFCFDADCAACMRSVQSMQSKILLGTRSSLEIQLFGKAMWTWAGCTDWSGTSAYPEGGLGGSSEAVLQAAMKQCFAYDRKQLSGPYKSKSLYVPDENALDASFESLALQLVTTEPACQTGRCYLQLSYVGGAMTRIPTNSAFIHRTPGSHLQIIVYWDEGTESSLFLDWSRRARASLLSMSINESYQNYLDADLSAAEWPVLYFGNSGIFERLIDIKCRYNPTGVLDVQSSAGVIPARC